MTDQFVIRILSVDSHPVYREGIAAVIKNQSDMVLVAEAGSGGEALRRFREHRPDVTLMDMRLPDSSGIEAMIAIRTHFPEARVILVTTFEGDVEINGALQAGAWAYILKTMAPREMVEMIRLVYAGRKCVPPPIVADLAEHLGGKALTSREVDILARVASGYRNRGIWQRLFISEEKVKSHLKQIMRKLGARGRTNALTFERILVAPRGQSPSFTPKVVSSSTAPAGANQKHSKGGREICRPNQASFSATVSGPMARASAS
jgi:DNA-binding NarL/FixJ family response regulator